MSLVVKEGNFQEQIWTDIDGVPHRVGDMDEQHVRNALRMMIRKVNAYNNRKDIYEEHERSLDNLYWDIRMDEAGDR